MPERKIAVYSRRSVLIIPGAGEVYAENYWLAGTFLALEGLAWYGNTDYNHKGDVTTNNFRFCRSTLERREIRAVLNDYAKNFPGGDKAQPIAINPNTALQPWQRIDWQQLNYVEMLILNSLIVCLRTAISSITN